MVALNPYVLLAFLAFAGVYATVEKVKGPVKAAVVKVEHGAKKVGHGFLHVVTFGQK